MPTDPRTTVITTRLLVLLGAMTDPSIYHFTDYEVRQYRGLEPERNRTLDLHFFGSTVEGRKVSYGGATTYNPIMRVGVTAWGGDYAEPIETAQKMEMDVKTALMSATSQASLVPLFEKIEWTGTSLTQISAEGIGSARVEIAFDIHYFEQVGAPELEGV